MIQILKTIRSVSVATIVGLGLTACMPALIQGHLPTGGVVEVMFYPGGSKLDDLMIVKGTNYFGKAQYQMNDDLGDIGFRLKSNERVMAECTLVGKNVIGKDECKQYTVVRSTFSLIPEGTKFLRPETF